MRRCRRGWLSGGLALALSAPVLLAGCALAPAERDEQADDAWGERDSMTSDEALGWDADGEDVGRDVDAPVADPAAQPQLRPREAAHPSAGEGGSPTRTYARSQDTHMPEPLPWHAQGSTESRDKTSSESDGTR
ncbi:hypothetical protein WMF04_13650 [Sorangium sp. So ce260]|uniref:hypothetical protein n=1 Tax=Sorangium sp. So ce260 TaxID=3133291 RepID=UPI003F60E371